MSTTIFSISSETPRRWGLTLLVLCISLPLGLAGYFAAQALPGESGTTPGDWANVR